MCSLLTHGNFTPISGQSDPQRARLKILLPILLRDRHIKHPESISASMEQSCTAGEFAR